MKRDKLGRFKKANINVKSFAKPLTLESCYWAGFIAADGYLRKNGPKEVSFGLNIKDIKHLIKLKKFLKHKEGNIKRTVAICNNKKMEVCRYSFTNENIYEDLINNFNITNKKSLTLKNPNLFGKEALAFIKGYIDGDGSIFIKSPQKGTIGQLSLSFLGTEEMLNWIKINLNINDKKLVKAGNKNTFRLQIVGNIKAYNILCKLHNIETPELKRKWDKLKRVKR